MCYFTVNVFMFVPKDICIGEKASTHLRLISNQLRNKTH